MHILMLFDNFNATINLDAESWRVYFCDLCDASDVWISDCSLFSAMKADLDKKAQINC